MLVVGIPSSKKCCIFPLVIGLSFPFLSDIMSSSDTILEPVPCHDFLSQAAERDFERMGPRVRELSRKYIHREVSGGTVVGGVDSYLVESGFCEVGNFCSIEGYRFWLGKVVRVGVDFLELEIESPLDFERVGSILVPDRCFTQASLFAFPSQVWWVRSFSSLWPWSQLPSILPVEYWAQVNTSSSCSAAVKSSLGLEESFRGSFSSRPAFLLYLLSSLLHEIPHSEPFPSSSMGEVTRLSEEGFSFPSLDLGEEEVTENSRESSEIELRVLEWGMEGGKRNKKD